MVTTMHRCQNCDWEGGEDELRDIRDLFERVQPGEPMPSGECPECTCLTQPIVLGRSEKHGGLLATVSEIQEARDEYVGRSDGIEIDDNAAASRSDDGLWVSAWVWLPRPEWRDENE